MNKIINNRTLTAKKMLALPPPIILCVNRIDYDNAIIGADILTIDLNLPLAKALVGKSEKEIHTGLTKIIIELLPKGSAIYLRNFEMLFDPRYKLDAIKLFCEISRYNKLIVKWCGIFDKDTLYYAEPGYDDYLKFKVSDYEIACVI